MRSRIMHKALRAFCLQDTRCVTLLLLGISIYLLLFSAFGRQSLSTLQVPQGNTFPRKLWQTWKTDPVSFEDQFAQRARSWFKQNPTIRYEVMTDANSLSYVQHVFSVENLNRPDIVEVFQELNSNVVKADLLRYIIMYAEGGIYADVDVEALNPFEDFLPGHYQEKDVDMIVGIETDQPQFKDHPILGLKAQSFCQWTFACKPRHPAMLRLINNILEWIKVLQKQQQHDVHDLRFDFDAVINGTGPTAFTNAILAQMSASTGGNVDWSSFHKLRESKAVGRILVLPSEAFAASTGHSDSGTHNAMGALVKHYFGASQWTRQHQRYKHPVYGEIERCNWDPVCVKLWDQNTARFNALPKEEQLAIVLDKEKSMLQAPPPTTEEKSDSEPQTQGESPSEATSSSDSENKDGDESNDEASKDEEDSEPKTQEESPTEPEPSLVSENKDDAETNDKASNNDEGSADGREDDHRDEEIATTSPTGAQVELNIPDVETLEAMLLLDP